MFMDWVYNTRKVILLAEACSDSICPNVSVESPHLHWGTKTKLQLPPLTKVETFHPTSGKS